MFLTTNLVVGRILGATAGLPTTGLPLVSRALLVTAALLGPLTLGSGFLPEEGILLGLVSGLGLPSLLLPPSFFFIISSKTQY